MAFERWTSLRLVKGEVFKTEAFKLRIQSVYFFFLLIFKKIILEFRIREDRRSRSQSFVNWELNRFPISFHA